MELGIWNLSQYWKLYGRTNSIYYIHRTFCHFARQLHNEIPIRTPIAAPAGEDALRDDAPAFADCPGDLRDTPSALRVARATGWPIASYFSVRFPYRKMTM